MITLMQDGPFITWLFVITSALGPVFARPLTGNLSEETSGSSPVAAAYANEHLTSTSVTTQRRQHPLFSKITKSNTTENHNQQQLQRSRYIETGYSNDEPYSSGDTDVLSLKAAINKTGANLTADDVCSGRGCTAWTLARLTKDVGRKPHLLIIPLSAIIVFVIAIILKGIRWCNEDIKEADLKDMRYVNSSGDIVSLHHAYAGAYRCMLGRSWYDGGVEQSSFLQDSHIHRYIKRDSTQRRRYREQRRRSERRLHASLHGRTRGSQRSHRRTHGMIDSAEVPGRLTIKCYNKNVMEMSNILEQSSICSDDSRDLCHIEMAQDAEENACAEILQIDSSAAAPNQSLQRAKHSSSGYVSDRRSSHSVGSELSQDDLTSLLPQEPLYTNHTVDAPRTSDDSGTIETDVFIDKSFHSNCTCADQSSLCANRKLDLPPCDRRVAENPHAIPSFVRDLNISDYTSSDGYENDFETAIEKCIMEGVLKSSSFNSFMGDSTGHIPGESQYSGQECGNHKNCYTSMQTMNMENLQSFVNSNRCILPDGMSIGFSRCPSTSSSSSDECGHSAPSGNDTD